MIDSTATSTVISITRQPTRYEVLEDLVAAVEELRGAFWEYEKAWQ